MRKLYDFELSVNCYKCRLLMSILKVEFEIIPVDFYPGLEHKSQEFKEINPLGHIPVLDDNGYVIRDAHAILVYLAAKYDASQTWYPTTNPELLGETASWMLFAEGTTNTASAARLHINLGYDFNLPVVQAGAHKLFRFLDEHLWFRKKAGIDWVCNAAQPTIADIALFPDVVLAEEGGISLFEYPSLRLWTDRVKRIPGFIVMGGIFPASSARK